MFKNYGCFWKLCWDLKSSFEGFTKQILTFCCLRFKDVQASFKGRGGREKKSKWAILKSIKSFAEQDLCMQISSHWLCGNFLASSDFQSRVELCIYWRRQMLLKMFLQPWCDGVHLRTTSHQSVSNNTLFETFSLAQRWICREYAEFEHWRYLRGVVRRAH